MEKGRIKGEWVISSATPNRKERLESHREFEASDLKRMLDDGWEPCIKPKRPRFKREKKEPEGFKLFGTITLDIPVEILIKAGFRK